MAIDSHALTTTEHSPVAGLAHDARGGISNPVLGMLLFITSEVMFFAGLFAAYFNVRANAAAVAADHPGHRPARAVPPRDPAVRRSGHGPPDPVSSFTCQFAVWAIRRGDRTAFLRNMAVTFVIGIVFLIMQGIDYAMLGHDEHHHPHGGDLRDDLLHAHRLPRGARLRWRDHAGRGALPRHGRPVLRAPSRCGGGRVAVLALRGRGLDPAVLAPLPAPREVGGQMHPLRHPRNSIFVGLIFVVIGILFWAIPTFGGWHVDYAGVTMLLALGVAMAIMAYVLIAGSPNE